MHCAPAKTLAPQALCLSALIYMTKWEFMQLYHGELRYAERTPCLQAVWVTLNKAASSRVQLRHSTDAPSRLLSRLHLLPSLQQDVVALHLQLFCTLAGWLSGRGRI